MRATPSVISRTTAEKHPCRSRWSSSTIRTEDADYLIYNASIDSTVKTLDDLLAKDSMFADYKAVKEGNVWTTEKSMYQATDKIAQFTNDINLLVTGGDPDQMVFLRKLS